MVIAIDTPRLRIRPFAQKDWKDVHSYMSDSDVTTYLPEERLTGEQTKAFVTANTGGHARAHALVLKDDARLIGHMFFHPWFGPRTYEIGWVVGSRQQGHGYATEAALALLDHGFGGLRLHRIIATCQPENVASWRVMEKIGMRREAHFRKCFRRDETIWWDEYFYALLEEEWSAGKR